MRFFRRKKIVVKKKFQFELLSISLFYVALFVLVFGITLFLPLFLEMKNGDYESREVFQAAGQILYLHDHFWTPVILTLLLICLHSLRTSHRVAGALYRFNLAYKSLKEGILPGPVTLRKHDFLMEEAENLNLMLESLRERLVEVQEAKNELKESISACRSLVANAPREEIQKSVDALQEMENELENKLDSFLTDREAFHESSESAEMPEGFVQPGQDLFSKGVP